MSVAKIVDDEAWIAARKELLAEEKAFTRARDALAAKRRALPWRRVAENYLFETETGTKALDDLFGFHSQLIVQHFMYGPDWKAGCPSCSFWADNFDHIVPHLAARNVAFTAVSRAPLEKLLAYRQRMGWTFPWASSYGTDFNRDFGVTFEDSEVEEGRTPYNYTLGSFPSGEAPGISVFAKKDGHVFHTYSAYARGLEDFNGAYRYLDATPYGRNEDALPHPMAWVERHDEY